MRNRARCGDSIEWTGEYRRELGRTSGDQASTGCAQRLLRQFGGITGNKQEGRQARVQYSGLRRCNRCEQRCVY